MKLLPINRNTRYLVIGGYGISISKSFPDISMSLQLPFMAFLCSGKTEPAFILKIKAAEPDNSGELLFGSDDYMIPTYLYRRESGFYDWITKGQAGKPGLSFRISPDWTEFTLYEDQTNTDGERAFHEFGFLFSYALLNHHACILHGVIMEYEGKGILVTAASGTGKTTHTRMWRDLKNALIINGDRCLCRKVDGIWYAYGMPWSGSSGEYANRRVPISCIVSLNCSNNNYTKPMSVFKGSICLMQRIFAPVWRVELQNKGFDICQELAAEIPMLELYCRPDPDSVEILRQALEEL